MQALQLHTHAFKDPHIILLPVIVIVVKYISLNILLVFWWVSFLHCSSLSCLIQILYEFQWTDQHGCEVNPQEDIKIMQISGPNFFFK
jgi:hypothetical protein